MHVGSNNDPFDIGVQGKFAISCTTIRIVEVVHVIKGMAMSIVQFIIEEFPNYKLENSQGNFTRK